MDVEAPMDLFEHRYYRLNKVLMKMFGQWPYQSTRVRSVILTVELMFVFTHLIPQIIVVVKHRNDWNHFIEDIPSLIFSFICLIKYFFSTFKSQKMLMLINHIRRDWETWAQDRDFDILHEYAKNGRTWTVIYLVTVLASGLIFMIQPTLPKIIDVLLKNGTEPGEFPIPLDYCYIDMQKYYFYIILHSLVHACMGLAFTVTHDSVFVIYVQHGCGLFATVSRKLDRMEKNEESTETKEIVYPINKSDMTFRHMTSCIDIHNRSIEFADLIDETYSSCFFFVMGFTMFLISLDGFQVIRKVTSPQETIRYIVCGIGSTVNLYVESYMGQSLMDHSVRIRHHIFNGKWYTFPRKTQKLLLLMIMRCNTPCQITAGKISVLSIDTFGVILKTSLSYLTLLRSI